MSLVSVADVFAGATVAAGALTIPSGTIVSFTPVNASDPGAPDMIHGLLETMYGAIVDDGAGTTKMTATVVSRLVGTSTLRRTYTFNVDLSMDAAILASFDVVPEPGA